MEQELRSSNQPADQGATLADQLGTQAAAQAAARQESASLEEVTAKAMAAAALVADLRKFDSIGQVNRFGFVFQGYESFQPETAKVRQLDDELRWLLSEASDSKFVRIPLLGTAGLKTSKSKAHVGNRLLFYKRDEVVKIWNLIDKALASDQDFKCLYVKGQPGTGKSTAIWWKTLSILGEEGTPKNILWVSLRRNGEPKASVYFRGTNYYELQLKTKQIATFLAEVPVELAVIDGAGATTKDLQADVIDWMTKKPERHAVFSSSSKVEEEREHQNDEITFEEVHSWKLEEFFEAFVRGEEPTEIYHRCSSMLYEEFGLSTSETEEEETDSGVKLSLEECKNDAGKWGALAEMDTTQESATAAPVPADTNAPAPAPEDSYEAKPSAFAAAEPPPEEEDQKASGQSFVKRQLPPSVAQGGKTSDEDMDIEEENEDDEVEEKDDKKDSDDNEDSNKRQKMLSKDEIFEAVRGRYKYSGGSARWMFNYSREQMDGLLDKHCQASSNRAAIADGRIGPTSEASTNYFFGSTLKEDGTTQYFLVSQRAVEKLFEHGETKAFEGLYRFAYQLQNPSFVGWVVEADFFYQVERAKNHTAPFHPQPLDGYQQKLPERPLGTRVWQHTKNKNLAGKAIKDKKMKVRKEAVQKLNRIVQNMVPGAVGAAYLCKPSAWNQGGYDAFFVQFAGSRTSAEHVQVRGHIHLRFIQVTKGKSHDLKLDYYISVIQCFHVAGYEVDSVEIVFILTEDNVSDFTLGDVHGPDLLKDCVVYGSENVKFGRVDWGKIAKYLLTLSKTSMTITTKNSEPSRGTSLNRSKESFTNNEQTEQRHRDRQQQSREPTQ